ncbi:MAG: carboxylesterase family protein [Opitutaceae bacterium]|nr:carboxylesterase family protein [Opitutaceae bacterium]
MKTASVMLCVLVLCAGLAAQAPRPSVTTEAGALEGLLDPATQVAVFKGVPFAAPPVGELRWREPQPVAPWSGIRDAGRFGPSPMQRVHGDFLPWTLEYLVQNEVGEDSLYLNVWTPRAEAGAKLPVVVYIPGGAFTEGSGAIPIYDGARLAARGLVVVTINYRLGIFGFFSHPELTAESPHHSSGNYGLLDQLAALGWVQCNIGAFGGDPSRVTVWGQSAGAFSVGALLASPRAKGLFQRALAGSGLSVAARPMQDRAAAEREGARFAAERGVADLKALRALPAVDLVGTGGFRPIVDGWLLNDTPTAGNAAGAGLDVPVMTGFMANDPLLSLPTLSSAEAYEGHLRQVFGVAAQRFRELYPAGDLETMRRVLLESARDRQRVAGFLWARQRVRAGQSPVYTYHFERAVPWPEHPEYGAFHSGELPYFFDNLGVLARPWTPVDRELADLVVGYLERFASTGNPNRPGAPAWAPVDGATPQTQQLGERVQPMALCSPERLEFWRGQLDAAPGSIGGSAGK